ncbi:MAG: 16S rRNA (cytosine(1402)-N(4))-methyltransferase RsmH [Candidatus Berkiellales bacterium]
MSSATTHDPVMLEETLAGLNIIPNGIYIDGTFGRGGHAAAILERLGSDGRLICFDKDPEAIAFARMHYGDDKRVILYQACFSEMAKITEELNIKHKVNGILLDLGVSSPQLEDGARGFSFMREGPLDMRMDPMQGVSAQEWLSVASQSEISYVLKKYGEESSAKRIAKIICQTRLSKPITTTVELANIVAASIPAKKWKRHPATKTFQAIRIHINQELEALDKILLTSAEAILAPKGRLALISFHSGEDRKVKHYFRSHSRVTLPRGVAIPEHKLTTALNWIVKRQRASLQEVERNPRSRSATLRVAEKNLI